GPEARTVLAHSPAFIHDPAIARGYFEFPRQEFALGGFGRVERGEMPAENLLGRVSLDPPGAGIPGHDPAIAIERENRVIPHTVHDVAVGRIGIGIHRLLGTGTRGGPYRLYLVVA